MDRKTNTEAIGNSGHPGRRCRRVRDEIPAPCPACADRHPSRGAQFRAANADGSTSRLQLDINFFDQPCSKVFPLPQN
jgi:hypothetical protein